MKLHLLPGNLLFFKVFVMCVEILQSFFIISCDFISSGESCTSHTNFLINKVMRRILKICIGINTQTIYKNYSYSANLPIRGSSKVAVF